MTSRATLATVAALGLAAATTIVMIPSDEAPAPVAVERFTPAEWTVEMASALAAREKLRRVHNAMGETVVDGKGKLRTDRRGEWDRYRSEQFLPASQRIETRICELRDNIPAAVKARARTLVKHGKLDLPETTWAGRIPLLEAASVVIGRPGDTEGDAALLARSREDQEPPQDALDAADIDPRGARAELPPDPTEDYTGYTKLDTGSKFSVGASSITVTNLPSNEDAYVYKDKGADHFDGFSHNFDFQPTALSGSTSKVFPWIIANAVDDGWGISVSGSQGIGAVFINSFNRLFFIWNLETGSNNSAFLTVGTPYYCTVSRSTGGTTVTLNVYSGAGRTSLVWTRSCTVGTTRKYRYVYAVASGNSGHTDTASAVIANLDIGEAAAGVPFPARTMNGGINE